MKTNEISYGYIGLKETLTCLGNDLTGCQNRSLFYNRFVDPRCKKEDRDKIFNKLAGLKTDLSKCVFWNLWIHRAGQKSAEQEIIYARQKSRMMINMSGGVMENAGLCLDRFGIPYIPGSAVKGCARRMAIQELFEARTSGNSPDSSLAEMLTQIAIVFGWGEQDWNPQKKNGVFISDFVYAIGSEKWDVISQRVASQFVSKGIFEKEPKHFKDFGAFAGTVSFLPAYPVYFDLTDFKLMCLQNNILKDVVIEVDVVTCHHTQYYNGELNIASDDEEPNPVKFPAIAAGHLFAFPIFSLKNATQESLKAARKWLSEGLKNFGIGAKTAAGYGWFEDVTEQFKTKINEFFCEKLREYEKEVKEIEEAKTIDPVEKLKRDYMRLSDQQFAEQAKKYSDMKDDEKKAFLLALKDSGKKETVKRWKKNKPELIKPWIEYGKTLNPHIEL